jgi:7-cyano-7-deazaguanine synthase
MSYAVKEIVYTLQGEGFHAGRAAVFLRFSGCNLWSGREGDRAIYPDCRQGFLKAFEATEALALGQPIRLYAPFLDTDKAGIIGLGRCLGVPLVDTWTCYEGGDDSCGGCGACTERREAFALAGVPTTGPAPGP